MSASNLALLLAKVEESVEEEVLRNHAASYRIGKPNKVSNQIKDFTLEVLQALYKRLAVYGTKTHTMDAFQEFVIELKNELK